VSIFQGQGSRERPGKDERAAAAGIDPKGGAVIRADFYDMTTGKPVARCDT
jgi:hypothetical protein